MKAYTVTESEAAFPQGTPLFHFNGVPIVVRPDFWPAPFLLTGLLAWLAGRRQPRRSSPQRLAAGLLAMPLALFADIGHALAHTVSARLAGAPMDEILLSSGMPRTLYANNDVPARTHIRRALGGPIFSILGTVLSLAWWRNTPAGSLGRDLAAASLAGHSFILAGSLAPLPIVDGGVILKWSLVEAGHSPEQADHTVRTAGLGLSSAALASGALLALFGKRRLVGGLVAAAGTVGVAAVKGWLTLVWRETLPHTR